MSSTPNRTATRALNDDVVDSPVIIGSASGIPPSPSRRQARQRLFDAVAAEQAERRVVACSQDSKSTVGSPARGSQAWGTSQQLLAESAFTPQLCLVGSQDALPEAVARALAAEGASSSCRSPARAVQATPSPGPGSDSEADVPTRSQPLSMLASPLGHPRMPIEQAHGPAAAGAQAATSPAAATGGRAPHLAEGAAVGSRLECAACGMRGSVGTAPATGWCRGCGALLLGERLTRALWGRRDAVSKLEGSVAVDALLAAQPWRPKGAPPVALGGGNGGDEPPTAGSPVGSRSRAGAPYPHGLGVGLDGGNGHGRGRLAAGDTSSMDPNGQAGGIGRDSLGRAHAWLGGAGAGARSAFARDLSSDAEQEPAEAQTQHAGRRSLEAKGDAVAGPARPAGCRSRKQGSVAPASAGDVNASAAVPAASAESPAVCCPMDATTASGGMGGGWGGDGLATSQRIWEEGPILPDDGKSPRTMLSQQEAAEAWGGHAPAGWLAAAAGPRVDRGSRRMQAESASLHPKSPQPGAPASVCLASPSHAGEPSVPSEARPLAAPSRPPKHGGMVQGAAAAVNSGALRLPRGMPRAVPRRQPKRGRSAASAAEAAAKTQADQPDKRKRASVPARGLCAAHEAPLVVGATDETTGTAEWVDSSQQGGVGRKPRLSRKGQQSLVALWGARR